MEYKVLTQGDSKWRGSFDADALQATLDRHALDGWRVAESFQTASVWKSSKTEIVIILEREVVASRAM